MRQFLVFLYPEEAGLAPSWPAGAARDGTDERTAPTEASGSILAGGREGKMEILAEMSKLGRLYRLHIFPQSGQKAGDGHGFIHLAPDSWETEVFGFLDGQMRK